MFRLTINGSLFISILDNPKMKYTLFSKELSTKIFRIYTNICILVYDIEENPIKDIHK